MITKEKIPWSVIKFSQLILKGNVWRSVWRICMLILGLKGLTIVFCDFPCHCHILNPSPCRSVADPRGPPPTPYFWIKLREGDWTGRRGLIQLWQCVGTLSIFFYFLKSQIISYLVHRGLWLLRFLEWPKLDSKWSPKL